ncbi:hypothetical protein BJP34_07635 [Moorena producens PAL-8-15-08-1]|uniref:Uncharacterized protein n=1 Tax=Moorena producens PAL-8-15-08-1 TaxID=1458985 RepID=A0A1D8TPN2_9CYAN|nr:hypothetical protein [Moorena producens]AOW99345.1 hypothetical protein BJP34_07635 [Moorena producens PAL-8-15-08-1]
MKDLFIFLGNFLLGFFGAIGGIFLSLKPEHIVGIAFVGILFYGIYALFFAPKKKEALSLLFSTSYAFIGLIGGLLANGNSSQINPINPIEQPKKNQTLEEVK